MPPREAFPKAPAPPPGIFTMRRAADGELFARVHMLWVWMDLQSGRPIRVPAEIAANFRLVWAN